MPRSSRYVAIAAAVVLLMGLIGPAYADMHIPVTIIGLTTPVYQGDAAAAAVRTTPGARCSMTVTWGGETHAMPGADPKTAGADGIVVWNWTIPASEPQGMQPFTVTCALGGSQTIATSSILVYSSTAT